jgi:serine/threonine protein kinase
MQLDNYQLITKLAAGGMAELHLARARTAAGVERIVVIKQMLPKYAGERGFVEMFLDEGRVIAALNHANIVQLYDMGLHDGVPYLVMEYLRGHNLSMVLRHLRIQRAELPIGHALAIASAMCAGLHSAHEAQDLNGEPLQIVHRDVSPQNIILTYDGAVKVIDFGIAKASGRIHETRTGTLKGKIRYMAPEQVSTREVDPRTDVYAIGVILYELLTLQLPYINEVAEPSSDFALMTAIAAGRVQPASVFRPDLPRAIEREAARAMSNDPADRHQTARALQLALDGLSRDLGVEAQPSDLAAVIERVMGPLSEPWRALLRDAAAPTEALDRSVPARGSQGPRSTEHGDRAARAEVAAEIDDEADDEAGDDADDEADDEAGGDNHAEGDQDAAHTTAERRRADGAVGAVTRERVVTATALPTTAPRRFLLIGATVGLVVVSVATAVVLRHDASPGAAPGGLAAETTARVQRAQAPVELVIDAAGAWAAVATAQVMGDEMAAIAATRDRYLHQVAILVLADLPAALAPCRGTLRDSARVAQRWLDDVGTFAEPRRDELVLDRGAPTIVSARYTLTAAALRRARAYYVRTFSGWGLGFANAAPDREPGVIVIESRRPDQVPIGAMLIAVDSKPVVNLIELAEHGAATVVLSLRDHARTWTTTVPLAPDDR